MIYKDIQQGSLEWFEIKWGKIGGTLSKGLFVNSDTLFIDLLSQRLEDFEPTDLFQNDAMERGNELEPFAIEYVEKYAKVKFNSVGWIQSDENELLGLSPDGITEDETIAVETKCLGRKKHTDILLKSEIPLEHIHQCIHYFTVNPKLDKLYFCAFRPESVKSFVKVLDLDSIVNIGTEKKPKAMTIEAVRDYSIEKANELKIKIDSNLDSLSF